MLYQLPTHHVTNNIVISRSKIAGLDLNERERKSSGNLRYIPPHLRSGDSDDRPSKDIDNQQGEPRDNYQNNRGGGNGAPDRDFNNR